ncbi:MAG: AEC family transporter, partial [Nanoarchaeota archaeon]|nr:AEC family transporter [Nanoarchaeota archaeon]
EIAIKIIPIILIFVLGYLLKKAKLVKKDNADFLLKLNFYVSLPALILISISNISLSFNLIYFPVIAMLIIGLTYGVSFLVGKLFHLKNESFGVFLVGTMIMNLGFTLPFFIAAYGKEGLARASLFDFGNGLLAFTIVYYLACKYGNNKRDSKAMIKKFIYSPPLWALFLAIVLNLTQTKIHEIGISFFQILGNMTIPLIMLSLGIYFSPKIVKILPLISAIFIRMFVGLLLGFIFVYLFNLEGLNKIIVLISASAPIGYNTLTFASMENLDKEFATRINSYSILIGIIFIPILIYFLS